MVRTHSTGCAVWGGSIHVLAGVEGASPWLLVQC